MKIIVLALGTITAFAGAALAQTVVTDTDGNGTYSVEELTAAYPDMNAELFAKIDANADGAVDADELAAAQDAGTIAK
ncbi:MAG: EF-hand domain-containing protein [Defluviimonas sp.]|uniref:EF-hand domain-containing protein n=1 Tax=Albidovulum sp. TaxID=1872424 RepID=UPI001DE287AC|nr:EF-hand domain-containing protein [Paracoccaceae bacterium]MCC0064271.1 EF-hand domain-containing protein [Defluviimonas sp.]